MDTSHLYFLRSEQAWSKSEFAHRCVIKIGISAKPRARIAAINGGPISFNLVAAIPGSKSKVRSLESSLHGQMESEGLNLNREYHWEERSCTDRMVAESAERLGSTPIVDIEHFEEPTLEQVREESETLAMTVYQPTPTPKEERHKWSLDDNRAVRDAFIKAGCKVLSKKDPIAKGLSRSIGTTADSISFKMSNFKYLETESKQGSSRYSKDAKIVWDEYLRNEGVP